MKWLENIWLWLIQHKDEILAFVLSGQFTALVVSLIGLVRQGKAIKANTSSTKSLDTTIAGYKEMQGSVTHLIDENEMLKGEMVKCQEQLKETVDNMDIILRKLSTVIEVQHIAYSTVKDESIRTSINNVILNEKYQEEGTRAQLIEELAKMKEQATKMSEEYQQLVEKTATKLETEAEPAPKKKKTVSRY